ncbi:MAG: efflux RND transporter periplasmic adaptor subunit [Cyclobacteriaceae bacterium]|nr:efflux RND transporter periplasmic adaptor subunit [Cyclobacteriaceae bacterium]
MMRILLTGLIFVAVFGCGTDSQERLEKLKTQSQQLQEEIQVLEEQLGQDSVAPVLRQTMVETKVLNFSPFEHYIETQGVAVTDQNITLTAKTAGSIEAVKVREGDRVKKGQVLLQLDNQIIVNSINEVKSSLTFATEMYDKQKGLWDQKIGSEVQYLSAKNNKEALENKLATLREQLQLTIVTSPINGTVDFVNVRRGEMAAPGIPLLRVVDLSNFEIKAAVSENYASQVKNGTPVKLLFPDLKSEMEAEINYTGRVIDPVNRTFDIIIRLEKPVIEIKPNMIVVVQIIDFRQEEAIVIPVNTIQHSSEEEYVYVAEEGDKGVIARKREVTVTTHYNGRALIGNGLKEGDRLITFGYQDLTEGQAIQY